MTAARRILAAMFAIVTAASLEIGAPRAGDARPALGLEPGVEMVIACDTKAVVVATDAAKASSGPIELALTPPAAEGGNGVWKVSSVGGQHHAAFAVAQKAACEAGCPLTLAAGGDIQLWAPRPNSIDKLADGERLLLAVLKPGTAALRASTFRGKDIEALEEGACRKVKP